MGYENFKPVDPNQFPNYLDLVIGLNRRPRFLVRTLNASSADFGLLKNQMDLMVRVSRSFKLLDYVQETPPTKISKNPLTFLNGEDLPSLAGLIFFGYNDLLLARYPNHQITMDQLYPEVVEVVPQIRDQIQKFPDILKVYPTIIDRIRLPEPPYNPQTKLTKTRQQFNITGFLFSQDSATTIDPQADVRLDQNLETVEAIKRRVALEHAEPEPLLGVSPKIEIKEVDWSKIDLDKPPR